MPIEAITVEGHYDNAVGSSDATSQGTVSGTLLEDIPLLRPGEVLEAVPGLVVSYPWRVHGRSVTAPSFAETGKMQPVCDAPIPDDEARNDGRAPAASYRSAGAK